MWVVNFGHPLTERQQEALEQMAGQRIENLVEVACQFDQSRSFAEQAAELVDRVGLSAKQWQSLPLVICPPTLAVIACAVLAELHGRMGYFPPVVRLRPVPGSLPPQFELAEIVDLQKIREQARAKREALGHSNT